VGVTELVPVAEADVHTFPTRRLTPPSHGVPIQTMSVARLFMVAAVIAALHPGAAGAQQFPLTTAEVTDTALDVSMPKLAAQVLPAYRDANRIRYLDNRFRLEMLLGRYADAAATIADLRQAQPDTSAIARALYVQYEILSSAMTGAASITFPERFAAAFRARYARLDDAAAAWASRTLLQTPRAVAGDLRWATPDLNGRATVSMQEALTLLRVFNAAQSYRRFAGLPAALVAEDEARRYVVEKNLQVKTPDGATICASVARPRSAGRKLPALMQFTIYADSVGTLRDILLTAAHGYAGVVGFTRGKACGTGAIAPYATDGRDAAAVIGWIARQPWSDGRVGMYGGSYSGFTTWAAAKYAPPALKAIMAGASAAPGIDVPMEGNVFLNFLYPWPFYTANNRWLDNETYNDFARWNRLNRTWYTSGRPYRELEKIDGSPNPIFAQWISHPSLDSYWRSFLPQGKDYARINIPVLQTAGYFFGGPGAAVYYFREHYKYNPRARHYLLLGPYDHLQAQRGVVTLQSDTATYIAGYEIDPAAGIDIIGRLRYAWFDHVLKGAPRPALLTDRVNYEMPGANVWRHAPSIAAMSNGKLRMFLTASRSGKTHSLTRVRGDSRSSVIQTLDLADRSDIDAPLVGGLLDSAIDTSHAVTFVSEPLRDSVDVAGLLSGHLEVVANRRDFDFVMTVYELLPGGRYFQIAPFTLRASYAGNGSERRLLTPGKVESLDFGNGFRMMARRAGRGSRIVLTVSIPKNARQQINYGTGKDVSDESIADAKTPLIVRWLPGSYVDIPVRR
jgi:uncharacterized protein